MNTKYSHRNHGPRAPMTNNRAPKRGPRRPSFFASPPRRRKRVLERRGRRLLAFSARYAARLFDCPVRAVLDVINSGLVPIVVVRGRFKRTAAADRIGEQFDYIVGDFVPLSGRS